MREMRDVSRSLRGAALLLICLVVSAGTSFGADDDCKRRDPRVLEYDYATGTLSSSNASCKPGDPIAPNSTIQLKVKNINLFRRQVKIRIEQQEFTELLTVPGVITDNVTSAAQATPAEEEETSEAEADLPPLTGAGAANSKMRFISKLKEFNDNVSNFVQALTLEANLRDTVLLNENPATVQSLSEAEVRGAFNREDTPPPAQIGQLFATLRQDAEQSFRTLESLTLKPEVKQDEELMSLFESASDRFTKLQAGSDAQDRKIRAAIAIYAAVEDGSFKEEILQPVAVTQDEAQVFLDTPLTPAAKELSAAETTAESEDPLVILPVLGHRRPTFSTGIFFTNLTDHTYFKNAEGKAEKNEDGNDFTTAVGALVHTPIYISKSPDFSIPLSFGVAIAEDNPLYFAGISFIIGSRQRTVISVGFAGGKVDRVTGLGADGGVTGDQPTTTKVFRTNGFVGISYNF